MTLPQLRRITKLWQKRLRITDWAVTVKFAPASEMNDCLGTTLYDPRNMAADVVILDKQADPAYADGGYEAVLIHELMHIVLHGDKEYSREHIMQERAINLISDALYRAYRRKR